MPKSPNQKRKLLILQRIFLTQTDDRHPLSVKELLALLAAEGVRAERKSLYDDIEQLRASGLDIVPARSETTRYYVASRTFEVPELRLLVDSVQASRFITEKKSLSLISKLETLCSVHEAKLMGRQVFVGGRVKSMNESIYYSVDCLHDAIGADRQITFLYFEYDADKRKCYRHGGARYQVSPWALTWDAESYYLIGYDGAAGEIRHYRVDKMEDIARSDLPREGREAFDGLDVGLYTRRTFSMFGGETRFVTMEFDNRLAGVVVDRFGKDTPFIKCGASKFRVVVPVAVSPQFYGWVFALSGGARILAPEDVAAGMRDMLKKATE